MAREFSKGLYNSALWVKTRKAYFSYKHGICEKCGKPGEIVHHKIHLNARNINKPEITLSFDNLQLVCRECHESIHRPKESTAEGTMFVGGKLVKGEKDKSRHMSGRQR